MIEDLNLPDFLEVSEKAKRVLGSNWDLKSFKGILFEIMKIVRDPNASARELARLISQDQGLSARTLRIVNSPYYALPNKVNDLTQAISLLGFDMMKRLALSISVIDSFPSRSRLSLIRLWRNSLGTARIAELLAKAKSRLPGEAYTAGLLHHIGKLLLCTANEEKYFLVLKTMRDSAISDLEAERQLLETDHAELGFAVAKHWEFPPQICQIIAWHHTQLMGKKLDDGQYLSQIILLADEIASHIGLDIEDSEVVTKVPTLLDKIPSSMYENLDFTEPAFASLLTHVRPFMDEIDGMLKLVYF